jgi:hypothetical protein
VGLAAGVEIRRGHLLREILRLPYCPMKAAIMCHSSGMAGQILIVASGANAIIALRCCCISGKFGAYWEDRAA